MSYQFQYDIYIGDVILPMNRILVAVAYDTGMLLSVVEEIANGAIGEMPLNGAIIIQKTSTGK